MFENLTDKLQRVFKNLRGQGKLTDEHLDAALAGIREALLEGDVNVGVADELLAQIRAKAVGSEVMLQLSPDQQVLKIVRDELLALLGKNAKPLFASRPPSVWMIVGLQGSGKTDDDRQAGQVAGRARAPAAGGFHRRVSSGGARATGASRQGRRRNTAGRLRARTSRWKLCAARCARPSYRLRTWCWWIRRGGCTLTMT